MGKLIYKHDGNKSDLPKFLEGFLFGLGEVCFNVFGPAGETSMYTAIGAFFTAFLEKHLKIKFSETDPWKRYCHIIKVVTEFGFYDYVELQEQDDKHYWMLETGQYAGQVWEIQKAWERGIPACPLFSIIMYSLYNIEYSLVLDVVNYNKKANGYESLFHFEKIKKSNLDILDKTRKELKSILLPICVKCKKIYDENNMTWINLEPYIEKYFKIDFSHHICPSCDNKIYSEK